MLDNFYGEFSTLLEKAEEAEPAGMQPNQPTMTDIECSVCGRPMQVHMRLPIEPSMFERWLDLWYETAGEVFEPQTADLFRARAHSIARSLSLGLFFKPEG